MEIKDQIDYLNKLEQIKEVDPSPYLYTRIQERIKENNLSKMPSWLVYVWSFSIAVIVIINVSAIIISTKSTTTNNSLAKQMNLLPNYNIYQYE